MLKTTCFFGYRCVCTSSRDTNMLKNHVLFLLKSSGAAQQHRKTGNTLMKMLCFHGDHER